MNKEKTFDNMESVSNEKEAEGISQDVETGNHKETNETRGEDEPESGIKDIASVATPNAYVGKRNFIHQMMDVALMMANVSQLKALLASENNDYFYVLFTFIILSISLQVIFTVCMLAIWSLEKTIEDKTSSDSSQKQSPIIERKTRMASMLDRLGNVLVLFIIVSNVFITGFGVESNNLVSDIPSKTSLATSVTTSASR